MAVTIYYTASSLDGYIADEQHSLEWLFQLGDEMPASWEPFIGNVGAIAMGAKTYEWIGAHLAGGEAPGWPYEVPTWVFTTRDLPVIAEADIRFVRGDVSPVHEAMCEAAGERNRWVAGGGDLVGQFYDRGLLNEILVQVAPLTLGGGAPLLPRRIHPPMRLLESSLHGNGLIELHYAVPAAERA